LQRRGIPAARGGKWVAVQVARLLEAASIPFDASFVVGEAASAVKKGLNACRGQPEFLSQRKRQNLISGR
jgi:hypothetical protein